MSIFVLRLSGERSVKQQLTAEDEHSAFFMVSKTYRITVIMNFENFRYKSNMLETVFTEIYENLE